MRRWAAAKFAIGTAAAPPRVGQLLQGVAR
jgi:hypothetical protein